MTIYTPIKWIYKSLRLIIVTAILVAILLTAVAYVGFTLPSVQNKVRDIASQELSKLLGAEVGIDEVLLSPFNRVTLKRVSLVTHPGDTAATIQRLGAGISLSNLMFRSRIVIDYTEIIGLEAHLWRDSANAPLNIQPIIDALQPKDKNKPPTKFDLEINTVVIRKSSFTYDVNDRPHVADRFDPSHISVSSLRADLRIPRLSNEDIRVDLRRLAFRESSGFVLEDLSAGALYTSSRCALDGLKIELPETSLTFDNLWIKYDEPEVLTKHPERTQLKVTMRDGSYVTPADFRAFMPLLERFDTPADIAIDLSGTPDMLTVGYIGLVEQNDDWWMTIEDSSVRGLITNRSDMSVSSDKIDIGCSHEFATLMPSLISGKADGISPALTNIIDNAGNIALRASVDATPSKGNLQATLSVAEGDLDVTARYTGSGAGYSLYSEVVTEDFNLGELFRNKDKYHGQGHGDKHMNNKGLAQFGRTSMTARGEVEFKHGKRPELISASLVVPSLEYKGHTYTDLSAGLNREGEMIDGHIVLDNPAVTLMVSGQANLSESSPQLNFVVDARNVNLNTLNLTSSHPDYSLSLNGDGQISGRDINHLTGQVTFHNVNYTNPDGEGLNIKDISIHADSHDSPAELMLSSDIADAWMSGNFHWQTLPTFVRNIAAGVMPALISPKDITVKDDDDINNIHFGITVKDTSPLAPLVKLPVEVIYNVDITGILDQNTGRALLTLDAPYLKQKDKLIEDTRLNLSVDRRASLTLSTVLPTKKGKMTLGIKAFGTNNHLDTGIDFVVDREREFNGQISVSADFERPENSEQVSAGIRLNPGELVFNDTVWNISSAAIDFMPGHIRVDGFNVGHDNQFITIDGTVSAAPDDSLTLRLSNVNLDYIFETLDINNVQFGGVATGTFYASSVLSPQPHLYTPLLHVDGLKYNQSLMGNADIQSNWDAVRKAVAIKADVSQPNGRHSYIDGRIMPMADSLDFHFDADRIQVGFLRPFMAAFADDIDGYASGKARLWGSFKFIDMVGDIYAEDVSLKLGFTGTTYWATDSIHLTPGRINLENITLKDRYGHTGILNGWVTHKCFKEPAFHFAITDLHEVLAYDIKENIEHPWYGRVFANGSVNVNGIPGLIDIGVNVSTAPNTTFAFVLSDTEQANDYTFITFRDRDKARKDSIRMADPTPEIVRRLRDRIANMNTDKPSVYKMDFQVEVNPQALVTLVMDPVGGDRITSRGSGILRLTYDSANEDVRMFGTYTLTQGSYNFTLQDIIIKDFTIQDGSSISFQGDPYNAQLDLRAYYALNANLSDLDESFLQDKELNRTNVPVHAVMIVKGDMAQPDIDFDIEFPTLTQDTYRKVRSIVSTEEMMNRQIIYLLALNRFYTPDYMAATRGNELVSVASSTLSSQLGNILGQLSDKWSIAPNVRSDRGDFSDVEVDLALSSHLLNNRLLLNGNFGYRDKSLNTNTFIGDFDIEYLLNRAGTFRLKAYNRYNDQNYYLRSALTTQGVGLEIRRDFDSFTSFLRPLRKWWPWKNAGSSDTSDSIPAVLPHKKHATEPSRYKIDLAPAQPEN